MGAGDALKVDGVAKKVGGIARKKGTTGDCPNTNCCDDGTCLRCVRDDVTQTCCDDNGTILVQDSGGPCVRGVQVGCPGDCVSTPIGDGSDCGCDGKCFAYLCDSVSLDCDQHVPEYYQRMDCDCSELDACNVCEDAGVGPITADVGETKTTEICKINADTIILAGNASGTYEIETSSPQFAESYGAVQTEILGTVGGGITILGSRAAGGNGAAACSAGSTFGSIPNGLSVATITGTEIEGFPTDIEFNGSYTITLSNPTKTRTFDVLNNWWDCVNTYDFNCISAAYIKGTFNFGPPKEVNSNRNFTVLKTEANPFTITWRECGTVQGRALVLPTGGLLNALYTGQASISGIGSATEVYPVCINPNP